MYKQVGRREGDKFEMTMSLVAQCLDNLPAIMKTAIHYVSVMEKNEGLFS